MRKKLAILIIFNLLLVLIINFFPSYNINVSGLTIYVDLNGEEDYISIQEAIDDASDGDTIYVSSGIYYENIIIDKNINLYGSGKGISIIDGSMNEYVIFLSTANITIQNFTIKNATNGIKLKNSINNTIKDNTIQQTGTGIIIDNSSNNTIYSNNFVNNTKNAYDEYNNTWYNLDYNTGNYWYDYTGADNDDNGIGNTPYNILGGNNRDMYPIMQPITQKPHASFTYSPNTPTTQETVQFSDNSNDIDGYIVSWFWDFGDENTSNLQNPTHRYKDNDIYTITLNVSDDLGASNSIKQYITVLNVPPNASFYHSPYTPTDLENITFNDTSSDVDGYIINYTWDFGDKNKSYLKNPEHRYKDDGSYKVTLTIKDDDKAQKSISENILVLNVKPTANFGFTPNKPTINDTITFIDTSADYDGEIISWSWDLGDGTTTNESSPTHRYKEGRTYTITLTVVDNDGEPDTKIMNIAIWDLSTKTPDYKGFIIVFIVFIVLFSIMIFFVIWIRKKEK